MKYNSLLKKLKLSEADFQSIKETVAVCEAKTTGEIAVAVTPESCHYSFWELLASNGLAGIAAVILIPFADTFRTIYQRLYWHNEPGWIIPCIYLIFIFATVVIGFYLCNIPAIDRLVIPRAVKKMCVDNRAMRYFAESGVYDTAEHSGILIFVSYMERQVRIIADSGISQKISQDLWNIIADELAENLKKGNAALGFTQAIEKCGDLLAENFPNHEENPNELSDGLVILGGAEWY